MAPQAVLALAVDAALAHLARHGVQTPLLLELQEPSLPLEPQVLEEKLLPSHRVGSVRLNVGLAAPLHVVSIL